MYDKFIIMYEQCLSWPFSWSLASLIEDCSRKEVFSITPFMLMNLSKWQSVQSLLSLLYSQIGRIYFVRHLLPWSDQRTLLKEDHVSNLGALELTLIGKKYSLALPLCWWILMSMAEHWITGQPNTHKDKQGQMSLCTFMLTCPLCIKQAKCCRHKLIFGEPWTFGECIDFEISCGDK